MNEFVSASENLAKQLLPILAAIILVCLIVLLINLIKTVKKLNNTMDKADTTIDLVDKTIDKVQAPIDTVVKVSKSVETIHDETVDCVKAVKDFVVTNYDKIKDKFLDKEETVDEHKEPSPEDIIE